MLTETARALIYSARNEDRCPAGGSENLSQ